MLDRHLYLIGMPGSGKSSLGKRVAKETGLRFADMDNLISEAANMPVSEFFTAYGEAAFRKAETHVLCALTRFQPMIISTGGGTVINPVNRKIMRCWGSILLVDRPLEEILGDIRLERRPLLKEGGLERVKELYVERMPIYQSAADYILKNDQGYQEAVREMVRLLRDRFGV